MGTKTVKKTDKKNEKKGNQSSSLDTLLWVLVVILLGTAVVGNYYFTSYPLVARVAGVLVLVVIAGALAWLTAKGKNIMLFMRESRIEVRKVVWPTRQEAVQTTLIVLAVTIVMSLVLWGMDGILVRLVGWVTGIKV